MVVHAAIPLGKLGALLLKQVSKPIANLVKTQAKNHPIFRKYVCIPPAKFYNWCEVRIKMMMLRFGQPVNIAVLNEAASVELGAELLGEGVIFLIASMILMNEYNRSVRKEAAREEAKKLELEALQHTIKELFLQTESQGAYLRELNRRLNEVESKVHGNSWFRQSDSQEPTKEPTKEPPPSPPGGLHRVLPNDSAVVPDDEGLVTPIEEFNYQSLEMDGILFKALGQFHKQFLYNPVQVREPGVLTVALNFLCRDVYKQSVSF